MTTPIVDFVKKYAEEENCRFHMPGHKGKSYLGFEAFDITEVKGADALYEAEGIIAESEANATKLFGTGRTLYSTEGSSQCIRAMMYLAVNYRKTKDRPYVLAARNAHKAFLYAAALVDFDIEWLYPEETASICSCDISAAQVEGFLMNCKVLPSAVYVTSPDYLGNMLDIKAIAEVCHKYGVILAVDNAHGAYLHFLEPALHPMDLGADICCDSAHKTLPVLTGGAYLHISESAPEYFSENAKNAMALFGSTSPSYLTLMSLDMCNEYISGDYKEKTAAVSDKVEMACRKLLSNGWLAGHNEPLKLTLHRSGNLSGCEIADYLRTKRIECEYSDDDYVVFMVTGENASALDKLVETLGANNSGNPKASSMAYTIGQTVMTVREAFFSEHERVYVKEAAGRICASPMVSCPPAIPIVASGELIEEVHIKLFEFYGINEVEVVKLFD